MGLRFGMVSDFGTSKTMVMVLYTIIPPAPSSNILDSTWDSPLNPIEMGQEWTRYVNHGKAWFCTLSLSLSPSDLGQKEGSWGVLG